MIARTTSSGHDIFYWEVGTGPPLILVHGAACDADFMRPLADRLDTAFRCIALDRLGYQRSSPLERDTTIDEQLEAIHAVHTACTTEPAWVYGHSSGGNFALAYAVRYPEAVAGLVLMEPALYAIYPVDNTPPAIATMMDEILPIFRKGDLERGMEAFDALLEIKPESMQAFGTLSWVGQVDKNVAAFAHDQPVVVRSRPTDEQLAACTAPTLLLEGDQTTRLLRDIVALLAPKLPNATVATLTGCDHLAPLIQPDAVVPEMLAFVNVHAPTIGSRS